MFCQLLQFIVLKRIWKAHKSYDDYIINRLFGDMPEHNKQNLPRLHPGAVSSQPVAYMTANIALVLFYVPKVTHCRTQREKGTLAKGD